MHAREKMLKWVSFIIPTLPGGGAERVIIQLLQHIDRKRFSPCLVLFQEKGTLMKDLPSDVKLYAFIKKDYVHGLKQLLELIKLASLIKRTKPRVIVSFMWYTNVISLLARMLCGIRAKHKVIVSERTTLSFTYGGRLIGWLRRRVTQLLYPTADRVIAQTRQTKQELLETTHLQADRVKVIHNPVDIQALEEISKEPIEVIWFNLELPLVLSIGRLTIEKGFEHLIRAFAQVIKEHPAHLVILGEGKERCRLQGLVNQLGVKEWVHLPGFEKNPYKYLAHSTLFVLSSLYEGFPNVLLEALALGVPSVATRCPTGPEEIITDGVDGILVPPANESALADAIRRALLDAGLRKRLGEVGKKRALDFEVDKIVRQYEAVIEETCAASVGN